VVKKYGCVVARRNQKILSETNAHLGTQSQFLEFRQSLPGHFVAHTEWQTKPKGDKINMILLIFLLN
jgi:hypothetical protein